LVREQVRVGLNERRQAVEGQLRVLPELVEQRERSRSVPRDEGHTCEKHRGGWVGRARGQQRDRLLRRGDCRVRVTGTGERKGVPARESGVGGSVVALRLERRDVRIGRRGRQYQAPGERLHFVDGQVSQHLRRIDERRPLGGGNGALVEEPAEVDDAPVGVGVAGGPTGTDVDEEPQTECRVCPALDLLRVERGPDADPKPVLDGVRVGVGVLGDDGERDILDGHLVHKHQHRTVVTDQRRRDRGFVASLPVGILNRPAGRERRAVVEDLAHLVVGGDSGLDLVDVDIRNVDPSHLADRGDDRVLKQLERKLDALGGALHFGGGLVHIEEA